MTTLSTDRLPPTTVPTRRHADVLIVGAGIIGLSLAYELAKRGQKVVIVDAQAAGKAASWAGVGILPPVAERENNDSLEQLRALSHRLLAEWSQELTQRTGIDTGYRRCGGVYVATTTGEAATLAANRLWWDELGIQAESWTPDQLVQHEPSLNHLAYSGRLKAIWSLPGECQLRTPWYVRALMAACRQLGVIIEENCRVESVHCERARVTHLDTSMGPMSAEHYCVTAGPWTRLVLEQMHVTSGIMPIRGQVILMRPQSERPWLTRIINEGHRYLVTRDDGCILVGSNEEEVGYVCETTDSVLADLKAWAEGMIPELGRVPIERSWAGLRPGSFDSYPYIGALPDRSNLYVAAGHFRAGIHLSAGTARVMADLITTGRSEIDLTPFRAGRG